MKYSKRSGLQGLELIPRLKKLVDLMPYLHEWFEVAGIVPAALAAGSISGIPATKVWSLQNGRSCTLPTRVI